MDGEALETRIDSFGVSATDAGVSIKRDGDALVVYVARGLAVLTSPGGRVEINAGEEGRAGKADKPKVSPVAFWQDWTGGMGDPASAGGRASRFTSAGTGRLYGLD